MLAIRNSLSTWGRLIAVFIVAATLAACASKEPQPLIADESAGRESALPWNQQEKWESEGQFGAMADRMTPTGGR